MDGYVITIARFLNSKLDAIGVALSALCGVHCAAMPALVASGLLFSQSEHAHDYTHYVLFATAVPVTLLAFWRVIRHRHAPWILAVGGVGLMALWIGLSQEGHDLRATMTTLTGASLLAVFHLHHWRLHRLAHAAGHDHDGHGHAHGHGTGHAHASRPDNDTPHVD